MKKTITNICLAFIFSICLSSCGNSYIIDESRDIDETGWSKDDVQNFKFNINDTATNYQILINVRHSNTFKTQNLWLFTETSLNGKLIKRDTVECFLANNAGEWLGSGFGSLHEMPILYEPKVAFKELGNYEISIRHGMRDMKLEGISDIGLQVIKLEK